MRIFMNCAKVTIRMRKLIRFVIVESYQMVGINIRYPTIEKIDEDIQITGCTIENC